MRPASSSPRSLRAAAALLCLAGLFAPALASAASCNNRDDLPPVDEAFVFSAQATAADRIELQWQIAPGCYLYRHQFKVQADAGFAAQALELPPGQPHVDDTFGRVETYRTHLTAVLPGQAQAASTTLKVRYQGCADANVCYPPQTRTVTVALPGAAAEPAPFVNFGGRTGPGVPGAGGLLGATGASQADAVPLAPEQAFGFEAIVGDANTLLLRFTPARGYYLYRDKTRLSGQSAGAPVTLGAPGWPKGSPWKDEHFGQVVVYFDQIDVPLPLKRSSSEATAFKLTATFQGCQTNGICYPPMTRTIDLQLPAGGKIATAPVTAAATANTETSDASASTATVASAADPGDAESTPTTDDGQPRATPATAAAPGAKLSTFSALVLALLGGLILNLMPCVLPVLSLKALSLAGNGEDPARARRHALWYTAGVLLSFVALGGLALALRQAGLALGWGFQLQQPVAVAVLALLMLGLGLSMSGVWHVGGRWTGMGHALTTRAGPAGDFFTGVLAVVVATPCTAPFMGTALAWAFAAPTLGALLVFLMLGLGLALPFLLIGFMPALAHRLPRPGAWMETFKQLLAFPLYLTAAWLAWVLAKQRGADAIGLWMLAAVLLALAAWAWTRARTTGHRWATVVWLLAALALLWPLYRIQHLAPAKPGVPAAVASTEDFSTEAFSEQRLAQLRAGGQPVFVNMTADWCVTCKVNERAIFHTDAFADAMRQANAVYMIGDYTDVDPELTRFLQRYKAVGVPLYVVFPPGEGEGRVLPPVLTPDTVRSALEDAAAAR